MKRQKIQYNPANDYYKRLGIPSKASPEEIQQAYRRHAKKLHPDVNPQRREWATDQFQLLNEAYDVLSDPEQRAMYDQQRYPHTTYHQSGTGSDGHAGKNWWDVPHARQPGYNGIRSRPSSYRSPFRSQHHGEWLNKYHLGFLRPVYAPVADLFDSPYRYLLGFLSLVLIGNMIFIVMDISKRQGKAVLSSEPVTQPAPRGEGVIPAVTPAPTVTIVVDEIITLSGGCAITLHLERVEPLLQTIKLTASVNRADLRSSSVRFAKVEILNVTQVRRLDEWQNAELIFQDSPALGAGTPDKPLFSLNMSPGHYLLVWTPIMPDGTTPGVCQQLFSVAAE